MFTFAILVLIPALALAQNPHDQLENKLFGLLDGNKDGKITKAEGETYFLSYDADKDGKISAAEFKTAIDKVDPALSGHENTLYGLLDRNNDGHVDKSDIDALLALADLNHDGEINKHEFHEVFQRVVIVVG